MTCTPTCVHPAPAQAHCPTALCHQTFNSPSGFDRHRRGGLCLRPAEVGMVIDDRGVWRMPISDADRVRLAARRGGAT